MIERWTLLKNCPNCGGVLNEAGRCEFCGSKVYDFLSINFDHEYSPSAPTYIRIKVRDRVILAPIRVDTVNMEMPVDAFPTISIEFMVVGDTVFIEQEGYDDE